MRQSLAAFNARSQAAGRPPIAIAMGFATGIVCVGNIGSRDRFNYTAIGEAVNTAARIEASCRRIGYDIVTTRHSVEMMAGRIATLAAGHPALKGISEREELCVVIGDEKLARSEAFAELRQHHTRLINALVSGDAASLFAALDSCKRLIGQIEPGLSGVYDALRDRRADFI